QEVARLQKEGWKYTKVAYRQVLFFFGEISLKRRVLVKDGQIKKPLDEWLGLDPYVRFSPIVILKIAEMLTLSSYAKTSAQFNYLKNLFISKDTISEVRKVFTSLYRARAECQKDEDIPKRQVKRLYLEGDGIVVKAKASTGRKKIELAHFLVHEGVEVVNGERRLINKHRVISANHYKAKQAMMDYIDQHYELTADTLLITNSDMGIGYGPAVFESFSKFLGGRWEHFWDEYHLNRLIFRQFQTLSYLVTEAFNPVQSLYKAIKKHDKKEARRILDTVASMIEDDESLAHFENFARRLLRFFKYTQPALLRGLSHEGIGVMESQNALIADRMKARRMSWTVEGAETVAQMVIDASEGTLRSLFFGHWRSEWQKMEAMPSVAFFVKSSRRGQASIRHAVQANKSGRRLR
ncbi:ISLre2 family transposase, partial [Lactococcus taiwanensis]|uniref:ISLre2 family transposase n=1 Tax=Lactococcus taiwanensis TaxID=1151742 RepID=UPI00351400BA